VKSVEQLQGTVITSSSTEDWTAGTGNWTKKHNL